MVVLIVRFKSGLSAPEVLKLYEARAARYRALPGLRQKYYLQFPATGEHGAVYLWESEEALSQFRRSELASTISQAYRIEGGTDVQLAEVVFTLRPEGESGPRR